MRRTTLESDPEALSSSSSMFDSIVVGAGSSGLTVARTLFERGLSVLIIEAGPAPFLTHILNTDLRLARDLLRDLRDSVQYSPSLASGGQFGNNFSCFGGRGLFWNGAAPRYAPNDFSGWPPSSLPDDEDYSWAETEFRVSTSVGETPMARRMLKILTTAGIPAEPGPFAVDVENLSVSRLSAGIASGLGLFFRRCGNATAKGDIKVATSTLVQSLIVEDKRVAGVVVSGRDISRPVEILSRSVVLCGGGIESVRLAAVSEVPDPADRIGKGIQEHLFYHALLNCSAIYDDGAPDSAILYVRAPRQQDHQWEIHAPGNRLFAIDDGTPWHPADTPPYELMIRAFAPTEKRDDNFIEAKPGPLGSAIVHFDHSSKDEETKQRISVDAEKLCDALGARAVQAPELGSTARFRAPGSSYHEAGGLDMGDDPKSSVTAADGSFHTIPNLVCADAAAFPRIGATNPHLTIVAVARRKAKELAARLRETN